MHPFKAIVSLLSLAVGSVLANPLPKYAPGPLKVVLDKSAPYYQEYAIPENEKAFSKDVKTGSKEFREVDLTAVKFPEKNPLIISAAAYPNPGTPYEAVANYLATVRTEDVGKIIAIHDPASGKIVASSLADASVRANFFKMNGSIRGVKVLTAFEAHGLIVVYGYNVFEGRENLHPWVFTKAGSVYAKKAGKIDIGFLQCLGGALQSAGTSVIQSR